MGITMGQDGEGKQVTQIEVRFVPPPKWPEEEDDFDPNGE
jgi:hypothetical protein